LNGATKPDPPVWYVSAPDRSRAVSDRGWMSAVFDFQTWAKPSGRRARLDLVNFERYQAMLRLGFEFSRH
jgi:hypothetical protein